ncbi:MAG: sigma-54 dependent transcriptional regulator [Candidatus Margulisbacteria bacterium]|nr:sigma-54 dependent transcriptional regulator [Candidatus Margulisiibacteriota bacterium]
MTEHNPTIVGKPSLLVVDDEADMLETFRSILKKNYNVITASSGKEALQTVTAEPLALVLLDIRLPGEDGLQILKKIKTLDPNLDVIMVTASKDVASAVASMRLGAFDFVSKPFDVGELQALIAKALEKRELVRENLYLRESLNETTSYCDLIGKTKVMKRLYETIDRVAPTDSTILINGESGTGKELVARAIHKKSRRSAKPFIAVNCAAIPDNLLESELFGYERGAFTGALERKLGKFELADGGTLFLDEIGCMPAAMQAKLLRVLEDKVIERVGGEKGVPINVRIISATNIDFKKQIDEGKFRSDLYYRLNVIPITLAPLRERKDDIPLFVEYFIGKFNKQLNKKVKGLGKEAKRSFLSYDWPGNIRELQNMIERVVVLARGNLISAAELPIQSPASSKQTPVDSLREIVENFEREIIQNAITENQGNISQAAKELKTLRTSLLTRMRVLKMKDS